MGLCVSHQIVGLEDCTFKNHEFGFAKNFNSLYDCLLMLGDGQYGIIYVAINRSTGERVAVKKLEKSKMVLPADVAAVYQEVKILQELKGHTHIVQFYDAFEDEKYVYITMEQENRFSEKDAATIARQILNAATICHSHGLVHRDLKPENLLFKSTSEDSALKMADFGLSDFIKPGKRFTDVIGTTCYIAPEVLAHNSGYESDIWSIGVITYMLLCGRPPFWGKTHKIISKEIMRSKPNFSRNPWPTLSDNAKDFVAKLLAKDPFERLNASEALAHPWLREDQLSHSFIDYSAM